MQIGTERVGVLLLNLGGPETLQDVQPFLYNLFADPDIIRLPPSVRDPLVFAGEEKRHDLSTPYVPFRPRRPSSSSGRWRP